MRTILVLTLSVLFLGCKKDPIPTLEGKWDLDRTTYKEYFNGQLTFSEETDKTGESLEFRSDGQMELIDQNGKRTGPYTIEGNTVTFLSLPYEIIDLTENSVTLLDHHVHGPGEYYDTYLHLRR